MSSVTHRPPFDAETEASMNAIAEQLPGYEVSAWYGLLGPAALPSEISARLAQAVAVFRVADAGPALPRLAA